MLILGITNHFILFGYVTMSFDVINVNQFWLRFVSMTLETSCIWNSPIFFASQRIYYLCGPLTS